MNQLRQRGEKNNRFNFKVELREDFLTTKIVSVHSVNLFSMFSVRYIPSASKSETIHSKTHS